MEDFKKLNERVEKILEQVNVTSMVNIGKNIFDTFMKRDILYSPDIQEQDKVSWYSDYKGITFLINIVKGDGTKKGQFVKKNNEMSLFVPPSYWKKYINKPFLNIAKNYLQDNYNIDINDLWNKMISNTKVTTVKKNLLSIEIVDDKINKYNLESILKLLEYGNRDIPPMEIISKIYSRALLLTQNNLGGE